MAESDDASAEAPGNLIDRPAAIPAAQVATVVGLLFEQAERGPIVIVGPVDTTTFQVIPQWFDGAQELALLHGEGADRKIDRRSLRQQEQRFEQSQGVLAAR